MKDGFAKEYADVLSGRMPKFKKTTAIYPEIEVQRHDWRHPFKEGVNKNAIDEITLQASSIVGGISYYEQYVIVIGLNNIPVEIVEQELKRRLNESVNKTK